MPRLRLRAELLISALLVICLLVGAILVVGRQMVRSEISDQVQQNTIDSLSAFQSAQKQQAFELSHTANLLAELPTLKALMTTNDQPTIQDASNLLWRLAGSDLFLLSNPQQNVMAFHVAEQGNDTTTAIAGRNLHQSLSKEQDSSWWFIEHRLYLVFLRPISEGARPQQRDLGTLAIGFRIGSDFASRLALATGSQIVIAVNSEVVASTLPLPAGTQLARWISSLPSGTTLAPREITLGNKEYEVASGPFDASAAPLIVCYVFKPTEEVTAFIDSLNSIVLILGISAVLLAAIILTIVSRTITRPLDNLVAGVRALAGGDYLYSLVPRGSVEIAELTAVFTKMRTDLLHSQRRRIANEQIAALGRAASSISHDLRHYLSAVVANAEFLYEADRLKLNRDEIYGEIKAGSDQMIDLLNSLRDLAREDVPINPVATRIDHAVRHAIEAVCALPEFRGYAISVATQGPMEGSFDPKKIERVFFNLLLNACQATTPQDGTIVVEVLSHSGLFEIRVRDNGCGVPAPIVGNLFDPFVSFGKSNSTGLGLAIASKIVNDHGGSIVVEKTSETGSVFLVRLPQSTPLAGDLRHREDIAS